MRNRENRKSSGASQRILAVIVGALLALGIELLLLLLGAAAVSAGVLRADTGMQVTAAACLIGCFAGGSLACGNVSSHRLPAGVLTGLCCFALILLIALISGGFEFGGQALIELGGCTIGGGLAGLLAGRRGTKKRKIR